MDGVLISTEAQARWRRWSHGWDELLNREELWVLTLDGAPNIDEDIDPACEVEYCAV